MIDREKSYIPTKHRGTTHDDEGRSLNDSENQHGGMSPPLFMASIRWHIEQYAKHSFVRRLLELVWASKILIEIRINANSIDSTKT